LMTVFSVNWNWNLKYTFQISNNITEIQIYIDIELVQRRHAQNEHYSIP